MNSASVDLSVISNDLANMNTVGYKSTDANFQDLFYQQIGSSAERQSRSRWDRGPTVGSISSNFTEGTISATGVPTDVAIDGQGYFVVNNDGEQEFTRAGNFSISSSGQLLASDGGEVMGYPAVNGVVNANQTVAPLMIPAGLTVPAKASSQFSLTREPRTPTAERPWRRQPADRHAESPPPRYSRPAALWTSPTAPTTSPTPPPPATP